VKATRRSPNPLLARFLERVERMHAVIELERQRQAGQQTTCASEAKAAE
jgi:hypothetical protein